MLFVSLSVWLSLFLSLLLCSSFAPLNETRSCFLTKPHLNFQKKTTRNFFSFFSKEIWRETFPCFLVCINRDNDEKSMLFLTVLTLMNLSSKQFYFNNSVFNIEWISCIAMSYGKGNRDVARIQQHNCC